MSRIKNVNTNTNINRININVPRQYRPRQPKKKTVAQAEEALSQDENQDRQASYQSQGISINPNVYGFNTSPINREVGIPETTTARPEMRTGITQTETQPEPRTKGRTMATQTRNIREQTARREAEIRGVSSEMGTDPMEESISSISPRMAVAEAIPFRSTNVPVDKTTLARRYSEPEFSFNRSSDFQDRLSRQEGFQPQSSFAPLVSNRMRDIQKQGRPDIDINEMARNTREAYRGEAQMFPFAKQAGGGSVKDKILSIEETQPRPVYPKAFENMPLEEALPPAEKAKRGRQKGQKFEGGYKTKPKPQKAEMITQTGESLNPREPIATQTTPKPKKKALRGRGLIDIEVD